MKSEELRVKSLRRGGRCPLKICSIMHIINYVGNICGR